MARPPSSGAIANRRLLTFILAAAGILSFLMLASRQPAVQQRPVAVPQTAGAVADGSGRVSGSGSGSEGSSSSISHSTGGSSNGEEGGSSSSDAPIAVTDYSNTPIHHVTVDKDTLQGGAIMPKLGNETLKAELGRAAWKLFHTTMARFPDSPTADEQTALFSYVHLFARLYPCGECAGHFRSILERYPPQVSGRGKAAVWACFVHNEVNASLGKPEFDCANIGDFYDCGCADDDDDDDDDKKKKKGGKGDGSGSSSSSGSSGDGAKMSTTAGGGESMPASKGPAAHYDDHIPGPGELKLEREGKTLGG